MGRSRRLHSFVSRAHKNVRPHESKRARPGLKEGNELLKRVDEMVRTKSHFLPRRIPAETHKQVHDRFCFEIARSVPDHDDTLGFELPPKKRHDLWLSARACRWVRTVEIPIRSIVVEKQI